MAKCKAHILSLEVNAKNQKLIDRRKSSKKCCLKNLQIALDSSEAIQRHDAMSIITQFMGSVNWADEISHTTPLHWHVKIGDSIRQWSPEDESQISMITTLVCQSYVMCSNISRTSNPLFAACSHGAIDAMEIFGLIHPPCLTFVNNVRESALHIAAEAGKIEMLKRLRRNMDTDFFQSAIVSKSKFGLRPLGSAVRAGEFEAAYLLLRWGGLSAAPLSSDGEDLITARTFRESLKPWNQKKLPEKTQYALQNARRALRHLFREDLRTFEAFQLVLFGVSGRSGGDTHLPALAGHTGLVLRRVARFCGVLSVAECKRVRQAACHLNLRACLTVGDVGQSEDSRSPHEPPLLPEEKGVRKPERLVNPGQVSACVPAEPPVADSVISTAKEKEEPARIIVGKNPRDCCSRFEQRVGSSLEKEEGDEEERKEEIKLVSAYGGSAGEESLCFGTIKAGPLLQELTALREDKVKLVSTLHTHKYQVKLFLFGACKTSGSTILPLLAGHGGIFKAIICSYLGYNVGKLRSMSETIERQKKLIKYGHSLYNRVFLSKKNNAGTFNSTSTGAPGGCIVEDDIF